MWRREKESTCQRRRNAAETRWHCVSPRSMPDSSQYWDEFHSSQIPTASQTEVHHQLDKPPSPDLWAGFPEADLPPGSLIAGHVDHPIVVYSSPQVVPPQGVTLVTQPLEEVDSVAVQSSPPVALSVAQSPPQETYLKPVHLHPSGTWECVRRMGGS